MQVRINKFLSLLFGLALSFSSTAATLGCEGTVDQLLYYQPGLIGLKLSSINQYIFICRVDTDYAGPGSTGGTTSPAACKAIYSALLSAKHAGTVVHGMTFNGDQVPANCSSVQPWSQVNVSYFFL